MGRPRATGYLLAGRLAPGPEDGGGHDVGWEAVLPAVLPPGDRIRAQHRLHLDPRPQVVGQARGFVRAHAPELPPETEDALLLLTSELVTNAVLHARTPLEIGLTVTDASVVVTVHDLDLALPQQDPYLHREGGWGLRAGRGAGAVRRAVPGPRRREDGVIPPVARSLPARLRRRRGAGERPGAGLVSCPPPEDPWGSHSPASALS